MCGTINPTNPRSPANETAEAQRALDSIMHSIFNFFISNPRAEEISSPNANNVILCEILWSNMNAVNDMHAGITISLNCTPENPPTENAVYDESISGYLMDKKEIPALKTEDTAIPESTSVVPVLLNFPENEIAVINNVVPKAPKNAPKCI